MENQLLIIMKKKRNILCATALVILFMSACTERQAPQNAVKTAIPDSDLLSYKVAKKYVQNYAPHAGVVKRLTKDSLPDTRCIWFSAERLRALADQIEQEKGDGVRFYLSTYDKEYIGNKQPHQPEKAYWGYNTLIMVSTQYINGNHVDYYTNSINANPLGHGFIVMAVPENRGELCPPPANCKDIGATLLDN
jgi:hypothetical protein